MSRKYRRRLIKVIIIISFIIASIYWDTSSKVELAYNESFQIEEEYKKLSQYAINIATAGEENVVTEEKIKVKKEQTGYNTLSVCVENDKAKVIGTFKIHTEFHTLEDKSLYIEDVVDINNVNFIFKSKIPTKERCIYTAVTIIIVSFTVMCILFISIPRKIRKRRARKYSLIKKDF